MGMLAYQFYILNMASILIVNDSLRFELDIPLTGILHLEEVVGLPRFDGLFRQADRDMNIKPNGRAHFVSAALQRFPRRIKYRSVFFSHD